MSSGRKVMTDWVIEALEQLGGKGSILQISRVVWENHEDDLRASGNLLFEWQYELRWAGDILRKENMLEKSDSSERGIWRLSTDRKSTANFNERT